MPLPESGVTYLDYGVYGLLLAVIVLVSAYLVVERRNMKSFVERLLSLHENHMDHNTRALERQAAASEAQTITNQQVAAVVANNTRAIESCTHVQNAYRGEATP